MNKASEGDGIPVELLQIQKDDAVKVLHSVCQQIWKTQQWPQDWKRSVFIPVPEKGNAKCSLCCLTSLLAFLRCFPPHLQDDLSSFYLLFNLSHLFFCSPFLLILLKKKKKRMETINIATFRFFCTNLPSHICPLCILPSTVLSLLHGRLVAPLCIFPPSCFKDMVSVAAIPILNQMIPLSRNIPSMI